MSEGTRPEASESRQPSTPRTGEAAADCARPSEGQPAGPAAGAVDPGGVRPSEATAGQIEDRLVALEERGAGSFDLPACAQVRRLLSSAEGLQGIARERLLERAAQRVAALARRLDRAVEKAARDLGALRAAEHPAVPELERDLRAGRLLASGRAARRLRGCPARQMADAGRPELAGGDAVTPEEARGLAVMTRAEGQGMDRPSSRGAGESAAAEGPSASDRYRDSLDDLMASFALARPGDEVPENAGPYNAQRIGRMVFDELERISPAYLRSFVSQIEELGRLRGLPELPDKQGVKRSGGRSRKGRR